MRLFSKYNFFFLVALLFSSANYSQNQNYSLIVVHMDPSAPQDFKQAIYSYHFSNGQYTGRELVMTVQGKLNNKDHVRTDMGHNQIYKNRYLITGIGNIIDLKDKKVVQEQKMKLVRVSNDSAIYYTNDAFKGKFYSVYNFNINKLSEVKALTFKAVVGQDIEFDKTAAPFKLNFYPPSKPKVVLSADAGYGQIIPSESGRKPDPDVWWIDNNSFVYTYFNKDNSEIAFVKVNISSKSSTVLGKAAIRPQNEPGFFETEARSLAQYTYGDKKFLVDAEKGTATEQPYSYPENEFSVECKKNSYGHIIKLSGKDIGKFHFQLKNFVTEKEAAALVKELVIGTESYQQGIAVWNPVKQSWGGVDAEDVIALIGWIKEQ